MIKLIASEHEEAKALIEWARLHPIASQYLIHNPNEGKRSWREGKKMKEEGLVRGVSDYLLAYPFNGNAGLWIELKRISKSHASEEQKHWIEKMRNVGYKAYFAYGWEHAKELIEDYLR
jgi:hypothetical protein